MLLASISGGLGVLLSPLLPAVLAYFPHEPEVRVRMGEYMSLRLWAIGAIVAIGNWYGGRGSTGLHMRASLIAMVLNLALNYLLIQGRFGAPADGGGGTLLTSDQYDCSPPGGGGSRYHSQSPS